MTKENRFEGLMGVVGKNKNAQTSGRSDVRKSRSKKKRSSADSAVSVESDCSKKSDSKSDVEASKSLNISTFDNSDIQTSKVAKSANPDYTRTTIYLPKKMHKLLKAIALDEEREMSSIVEELIETWMSLRK
jgi:hypothetical protein